jgi:hypothetical protein
MILLHLCIFGALLLVVGNYLLNLKVFRFPSVTAAANPPPRLSVLVPARNEELRLRPCISTLSDSDFPILEILILDDHSTDGTAALVQQRAPMCCPCVLQKKPRRRRFACNGPCSPFAIMHVVRARHHVHGTEERKLCALRMNYL